MRFWLLNEHLNSNIPKLNTIDRSLLSTKNRLKLNNGSKILSIKLKASSVVGIGMHLYATIVFISDCILVSMGYLPLDQ